MVAILVAHPPFLRLSNSLLLTAFILNGTSRSVTNTSVIGLRLPAWSSSKQLRAKATFVGIPGLYQVRMEAGST